MVNLLTEKFDIWISAQTSKSNGGRGNSSGSNPSPYGIKKLHELILELAVRGKLVLQDPSDEPASVLLDKIAVEKERLMGEGKIKKEEPLPKISEDEKPFELPDGWEWTRLGEVTEFVNGFAFRSSDFSNTGIGIVKIGDIQNGEITTTSMSRVNETVVAGLDASLRVNKGDMLIAMSGATTGKLGFNRTNEVFYINQRVGNIRPHLLYNEYLYYPLTTKIAENLAKSMGSAIPNLSTAQIKNIVFALPPIAEQYRIVARVDELMTLCDQLEQKQTDSNAAHQTLVETLLSALTTAENQNDLAEAWQLMAAHFDTLFTTENSIGQLKQTILQLAVMGKLVHQDPNDESASVLFGKIAAEKTRLAEDGKIKKQESLPKIAEDEKHFELPDGWEWARLGTCIELISGQHLTPQEYNEESSGIPYLTGPAEFGNSSPTPTRWTHLRKAVALNGDILLTVKGAGVGKLNLVDSSELAISRQLMAIRPFFVDRAYIYLCLQNMVEDFQSKTTGIAIPGIGRDDVNNSLLPVPPLAEQHRIVVRVYQLIALCDTLKARLNDAQATQVQLADAIVDQAVG